MEFPNDGSSFVYNLRNSLPVYNIVSKNIWMPEEDELLKSLIDQYGATQEWSEIAAKVLLLLLTEVLINLLFMNDVI